MLTRPDHSIENYRLQGGTVLSNKEKDAFVLFATPYDQARLDGMIIFDYGNPEQERLQCLYGCKVFLPDLHKLQGGFAPIPERWNADKIYQSFRRGHEFLNQPWNKSAEDFAQAIIQQASSMPEIVIQRTRSILNAENGGSKIIYSPWSLVQETAK